MSISLRAAAPDDSEALRDIQIAAFASLLERYQDYDHSPGAETAENLRGRFERPGTMFYFIKLAGEAIGHLRIYDLGDGAYRLGLMCILPEHQGNGYAQQAMRLAENLYPCARQWGLNTIKQEAKLRYLYEKMGYRLTGYERHVKDGMDLVAYEKLMKGNDNNDTV